ncbi:GlxA family transcriptional regulator [Solicola gregarius]|uniref:DJ-1/PfpI family protein n=1 Tax=Solicola gregarius TaxID=2908642 RepID=A0AA46TIB6_9ACTN|nr:DJ-1/PfpI family protein [Solicola gregarius]UYM05874.1 DJ-1/PfpI family protein [Solicola gregarius]
MGSHRLVVVGYDDAELVDLACVTSALGLANRLGAEPTYQVVLASVHGGQIRCESGLVLHAQARLDAIRRVDTVIVSGGGGHRAAARDSELVRQVRRLATRATRVASVCTGATVLAEARLLDGKRATTHWLYASDLERDYPDVRVDPSPIFVRDGEVATSGGVTASLDLTLAFIEEDHGAELARWVAMGMVTYLQRPGNQAQMSMFVASPRPDHATVRLVTDYVIAHPDADLSIETLAERASVSARQLTRLFREHAGETPGGAVRRMRLEIAARLMATTDLQLAQIAHRCGFGSTETLRQAFVAKFGVSPRTFRQTQVRAPTRRRTRS